MPQRLKLIVTYDGAAFAGWQSQSHRNTVQDNLERAFRKITGKITRVHGAGRTDAGCEGKGLFSIITFPYPHLTKVRPWRRIFKGE